MRRNPQGRRLTDIVADYADRINRGELPPGARLPPERTLAATLGVNRSTVALAYAELAASGLVERRQGSGTTVRGDLWGVAPDWPRYLADVAFQPTRPLLQRLRAAQRAPGVIDLSQSSIGPDLYPRKALQRVLRSLKLPADLDYADPRGEPRLRAAIAAEHERQHGARIDPETVLVTNGGQQAIDLIVRALLRPGDAIAIEQPSYYYSLPLFQSAGIRLLPLPTDEEGIDPAALPPLAQRHGLRLILLNPTYHNPTTTTLSLARRERLLAICRTLNAPLVEENGYGQLVIDDAPPPALHTLDRDGRVIYIGTLSKVVAPGLRLGWLIGPRPVIDRLADVKQQIDFGMSIVTQRLVTEFLGAAIWREHLANLRATLRRRRDCLARLLHETFGPAMRFRLPEGGLHLWVEWDQPGDDRARLDAAAQAGVVVLPGRLYGAGDGCLRLTFACVGKAKATEAVRRLATVNALRGGTGAGG
jgi:DNA-binding transcriptional MocR family regulator